jgi:hypothetical protein
VWSRAVLQQTKSLKGIDCLEDGVVPARRRVVDALLDELLAQVVEGILERILRRLGLRRQVDAPRYLSDCLPLSWGTYGMAALTSEEGAK